MRFNKEKLKSEVVLIFVFQVFWSKVGVVLKFGWCLKSGEYGISSFLYSSFFLSYCIFHFFLYIAVHVQLIQHYNINITVKIMQLRLNFFIKSCIQCGVIFFL